MITHDLLDVLTPADRVLVLETGQIVETGTTATVLAIARSRFGARFAGPNLVGGTAHGDGVLTTQWGPDAVAGESAVALFNPSAVAVYRDKPHGTPCNTVEVTVAELDSRGAVIRCEPTNSPTARRGWPPTSPLIRAELRLAPGDRVYFLGEGPGGHRPSEPVTVQFASAINRLSRPQNAGAQVGSITPRDARGSCRASN